METDRRHLAVVGGVVLEQLVGACVPHLVCVTENTDTSITGWYHVMGKTNEPSSLQPFDQPAEF